MNRIAGFYTHRGFTAHVKSAIRRQLLRDTVVYTGVPQQAEPEFDPWDEHNETESPKENVNMAVLKSTPRLDLNVQFDMNYHEVAALDALAGYSFDDFTATFYEKMGKSYLQPHENGLRSLFKSVREQLPGIIERYESAREVLAGTKEVRL